MNRHLLLFLGFWCAAWACAQTLRVRVEPETIYAGDAFRVDVAVDGERLERLDFAFTPEARTLGQTSGLTAVNGRVSSRLSCTVLAETPGAYRLERLEAVTASGKTLTFDGHPTVTVRRLEPDPALSLSLTATPEAPLPGDEVTLTLTAQAPALIGGDGDPHSPFVEADLFGRLTERAPNIAFEPQTGEDSPLRLAGRPVALPREADGTNLVWRFSIPYRAVRAGEQTFPAPILRDTRLTGHDARGNPRSERCATVGAPLTVTVAAPPMEGRPEGFVGAIGRTFAAEAALDTLGAKVGDPVRLTLRFLTDGDPSLLRAPTLPRLTGFRAYGEPVREGFQGGAAFVYPLRPLRAGLLEVPPLTFAWFDRATHTYRTVRTSAVPLRVRPSAQLVLLGDDGETVTTELPPALTLDSPAPRRPWLPKALFALGAGALLLRGLCRVARGLFRRLSAPLRARRPTTQACAALKRTTDPAEAAAILRRWAGRPALTPADLRAALPNTPEAAEAVQAYAALEGASYSDGADVPEARDTLRRLLPTLPRPVPAAPTESAPTARLPWGPFALLPLFAALFLLCDRSVAQWRTATPGGDAFVREQAVALSLSANTPGDYARAANLWLRLAREGDGSRVPLINAASCAFFARQPEASLTLLRRDILRHGRDAAAKQGVRAACARLERREPLGLPLSDAGMAADALGIAAGLALLFCAAVGHPLRRLRRLLLGAAIIVGVWAAALCWQAHTAPLPDALSIPEEEA